jgi:hypothetical protein
MIKAGSAAAALATVLAAARHKALVLWQQTRKQHLKVKPLMGSQEEQGVRTAWQSACELRFCGGCTTTAAAAAGQHTICVLLTSQNSQNIGCMEDTA